jgi:N-acetyl-gamma-glutamyl-phosphate reductase
VTGSADSTQDAPVSVGVVGAAGYAGIELLRLLAAHPGVAVNAVYGSSRAGAQLADHVPTLRGVYDLELLESDEATIVANGHDAVFLCTPHETSAGLTPALLAAGVVVVDLSAAFRLTDPAAYPTHYGFTHPSPELLDEAVYAMPETHRAAIASGNVLACPGCYPTSSILPVAPLLEAGLLDTSHAVIVDSTSGVSGAGRKAAESSSFCQVSQRPYGVFGHRHTPEITQELGGTKIVFTPHLGPFARGIATTIHAQLNPGVTLAQVYDAWNDAYREEPFVRVRETGDWPGVGDVVGTNMVDMAAACDESGHLIVCSAIDNLIKGASGQAVQAFNIRFGFPEVTALMPNSHGLASLTPGVPS